MITEDQYWNAQPPAVRALRAMEIGPERGLLAAQLAKQGFAIDVMIMVNGWGANTCMTVREADGMMWVSAIGQPNISSSITGAATPNPPWAPYDPLHPPAGSIKVSDDPAAYPAFDVPAPQPPPDTHFVGPFLFQDATGKKFYGDGPAAMKDSKTPTVSDGQQIQQDGLTYTAHVVRNLIGLEVFFSR